jgi:hypothetical protein
MVNLLPEWARWVWFGAFSVIVVVHATHPFRTHGVPRVWHWGHLLMAIGMAWMFLPLERADAPPGRGSWSSRRWPRSRADTRC